jgi:polyribonucleotide nucleotidyltransferase
LKSTTAFGAFVEIMPGTEGLLHISEMRHGRTEKTEDVVKKGDRVRVKLIERDERGRLRLSMKALVPKPEGDTSPNGDRGRGGERGPREERAPRAEARGREDRAERTYAAAGDDVEAEGQAPGRGERAERGRRPRRGSRSSGRSSRDER